MMKFFKSFAIAGVVALAALAVSCENPTQDPGNKPGEKVEPELAVELASANMLSADISITSKALTGYAYVVYKAEEKLPDDINVIFASGVKGELEDGQNTVTISNLEANTTYNAIFVFKISDEEFYDDIVELNFTTTDYEEVFTLVSKGKDNFKMHVMVPDSTKEVGNALRYVVTSLPMYNYRKSGPSPYLDSDLLTLNGSHRSFVNDTTFYYGPENILETDENGNPIEDEWTGDYLTHHLPMAPGEPVVVLIGEFRWGESEYGWGKGYYVSTFDTEAYYASIGGGWMPWSAIVNDEGRDEDEFWNGTFIRQHFTLDPPEPFDATFDINIDVSAVKGTIDIVPSDNVVVYCYYIADEPTYQMMLDDIGRDESYLQWLMTSYYASSSYMIPSDKGPVSIKLEEFFYDVQPETPYHLLIVGMGDENGYTQCFVHQKFETKKKSLPAPKVEVKAIANPSGTESPYEVWFNAKCTTKDAVSAKYAANYESEFGKAINAGDTYASLVEQGFVLTEADIRDLNSDEGLDFSFTSLPDATTVLAVLAYNEENTHNVIDEKDMSAVASARTIKRPAKEPVTSSLFTSLPGEWTMSGDVQKWNGSSWLDDGEKSCKVTICSGVSCPESLDEAAYAVYEKKTDKTREEIDALYEEFKQECAEFNTMLKDQNRLLCLGFGYDLYGTLQDVKTPYDLFVSERYTGYDNRSILHDFGPKWYIEITGENEAFVPVNTVVEYPEMVESYYTHYLVGIGEEGYINVNPADKLAPAEFPLEISGTDSFSVNPLIYNNEPYYLNDITFYGSYAFSSQIKTVSELRFTRGSTGEVETASVKSSAAKSCSIPSATGFEGSRKHNAMRKTPIREGRQLKEVVFKPLTPEQIQENKAKFFGQK